MLHLFSTPHLWCDYIKFTLGKKGKGATLFKKDTQSLICFESLASPFHTPCVHAFHDWCLISHISSQNADQNEVTCPQCLSLPPPTLPTKPKMGPIRFGIDIGGVIVSLIKDEGPEGRSLKDYNTIPPEDGAFTAIQQIVKFLGAENVFIVSKCGATFQKRTLGWLAANQFFEVTGMNKGNVHFVEKKPQKADVAIKLNLTHFVDDRLEILRHLQEVPSIQECYLYKPEPLEKQGHFFYFLPALFKISHWNEISSRLCK